MTAPSIAQQQQRHLRLPYKRRPLCGLKTGSVPTVHLYALLDAAFGMKFDILSDMCNQCKDLGFDALPEYMK